MSDALIQQLERGYQAQQTGDLVGAEQLYLQVLEQDRDNFHALNLLGMLCVNTGRSEQAIDFIGRALALDATNAQSHANIGLAYKDHGDADKAIEHLHRSTELDPDNPVVHNNLGNVLRVIEQPRRAVKSYEAALRLNPQFAECWSNLAAALNEAEQYEPGLRAVSRALQLDPNLAQAYNNRGDILLSQANYSEALASYQKATELSPKYAAALINMARAQRDMDSPEAAMATLNKALAIEPNNPDAHHVMGVLHEQMGQRDRAADSFKRAISAAPEMTVAHYYLSQLRGRRVTDDELTDMQRLWDQVSLPDHPKMYLAFGLYRGYEQRERYDEAFSYLTAGNRIKAEARPYDDAETADYLDAIVTAASAAAARVGTNAGKRDTRPVFVLGMPRSGTSLTEQVLASHSQVAGAGELSYGYDLVHRVRDMTGEKFPDNLALLAAEQFAELGDYYLSRHNQENLAARYVVDKTPLNFQYIGVLSLALPDARFVHCHRDPIANCYAIHRMPFDQKQTYAHDLSALGQYYTRYWQLMQQWQSLFPGRILNVKYEDTVADVERQSRRLLDFLDLPFEPEVLEFYNTQRLVKTPSASQVREPIYKDSVQAWKKYQHHLGPLIENLHV